MLYIRLFGISTLAVIMLWVFSGITVWAPISEGDPRGFVLGLYVMITLGGWVACELALLLERMKNR